MSWCDARYIVAPMVDASELPWRLLCRRHGAHLCYTPMLHANVFRRDPKYRRDALASCEEDRPLIVQFCGNDPEILLAAALLAEQHCDAIDINLGCPQAIAKRGHYGSFLQDEWPLLEKIVTTLSKSLSIPVTCKVRVFEDISKTVDYALMLQNAGCKVLTVHGRTREQKGPLTGLANWEHINAVKKAVRIPVFANGNIQCLEDVHRCLEITGANGVMSAEGILTNPALFEGVSPTVWDISLEYLSLVEKYPCPSAYIRGHLFKICHLLLNMDSNSECRSALATAQNLDNFVNVVNTLKTKYLPYHNGEICYDYNKDKTYCKIERKDATSVDHNLRLPPWICQPYVRITPSEHLKKMENKHIDNQNISDELKRHYEDSEGNTITRKKMKKLRRVQRRPPKPFVQSRSGDICSNCPNPLGSKCLYKMCKSCCRNKCYYENLDCPGHRILVKTRKEMAIKYAAERKDAIKEDSIHCDIVTQQLLENEI